ncbi:MAG: nucleotide exchange factor GrpE [Candidatus Pacebacteria bacterium]|nr:nucleotide exchange factor GrpE [Candidatus Paceibacterota bacterium]
MKIYNMIDDKEKQNKAAPEEAAGQPNDLLQKLEKERQEYFAGWQREKADFINYKNRELERLEDILVSAKEDFLLKLLPILDNFERAEKSIPQDKKNDENIKGLLMIKKQLSDLIRLMGAEEISCVGKKFDPMLEEAVASVNNGEEAGIVAEELEKGYRLNGKILRPAKVKITKTAEE